MLVSHFDTYGNGIKMTCDITCDQNDQKWQKQDKNREKTVQGVTMDVKKNVFHNKKLLIF